MSEKTVVAILNSPKKHSIRYDLFIEGIDKTIGSIYWPKDAGVMPEKFTVIVPGK